MKKIIIAVIIVVLLIEILLPAKTLILKKLYPLQYAEYVETYSAEYGVDKLLVYSVMKAESKFKEDVVSRSDAKGLMQVIEETAQEIAVKIGIDYIENETLYNCEDNIAIGIKYLSELIQKYDGNYLLAVAAYNAGIGNVDEWIEKGIIKNDGTDIENIPFKETNNYVRKIVRNYKIYKELYGEEK